MARGEEYKSQGGVFIGQDPNLRKNLTRLARHPRVDAWAARQASVKIFQLWVLDLVNT